MLTRIEAIIFDLDGVIIDSEPLHEKAQRIVFERYQLTVPPSAFLAFKGKSEAAVFGYVVEHFADNNLAPTDLAAEKHRVYRALIDELELVDGSLAFIEHLLRLGFPLGLTTSATKGDQERAFAKFDLDSYFLTVITADDVTRPKPHPEPYLTTAKHLDTAPASCLVIEDSKTGVQAALNAGCQVAGLSTTFSTSQLLAAGAHIAVDHFDDLLELFRLDPK